jgi:hypothetical protein
MLTILLHASSIVRNKSGDTSLHGYVETQELEPTTDFEVTNPSAETDFALLDSLSDILVQDNQVLAASFNDATSFTLVTPSSDSESELDHDIDFPPYDAVGSATVLKLLNATVLPNAINPKGNHQPSSSLAFLGEIHEIKSGKCSWTQFATGNDSKQDDVLWDL